tara:strand:+ start:48 stop:305 length:258 start_codon:yes stop_codon:yes gene_type:complete
VVITTKDSILKKYYEANGQQSFFGYDNLEFKTVNHPTPHRFVELCSEFKLKQVDEKAASTPLIHLPFVEVLGTPHTKHTSLNLIS